MKIKPLNYCIILAHCVTSHAVSVNYEGKVGAMGFMPLLLPRALWPMDLVRVDEETMEPIRDDVTGLCVRCREGEDPGCCRRRPFAMLESSLLLCPPHPYCPQASPA